MLLLDPARFKYPPHWVETWRLYNAMSDAHGGCGGKPRGWLLLSKQPKEKDEDFHLLFKMRGGCK